MMEEDLRGYLLAIPESEVGLKRSWIETTSLDNLIGEARRLLRK
jgi:hypothetical protein